MCKTITWALEGREPDITPHETNSLFYAEDFIRYYRYHTPFSIKYCIEGEMPYVVGNQKISVRPGSFFIANQGTELECLPVAAGTKALIVFFTEDFITKVADSFRTAGKSALDDSGNGAARLEFFEHTYRCPGPLSKQIQTLAQQMTTRAPKNPDALPELFFNLAENLLSFNGLTQHQINGLQARHPATRQELYRRLLSAREYMHDQWAAPLALHDIARYACLSPYHFHRSFQEAFGEAPMRWFRQLKMEKARELLSNEKATVSETALNCGFSDVFSFSKAFKRAWGVSPSACTRNNISAI
jgi:AraC family transcriptional regulator